MADALSEALQKLSAARAESSWRADYLSNPSCEPCRPGMGSAEAPASIEAASAESVMLPFQIMAIASTCLTSSAAEDVPAVLQIAQEMKTSSDDSQVKTHHSEPKNDQNSQVVAAHTSASEKVLSPVADCCVEADSPVVATSENTRGVEPLAGNPASTTFPKSIAVETPITFWKRPLAAVLEHRRHAAAVVVLICMAIFWFDDSTSGPSTETASDTMAEDFSDVEAALSEFDVRSAPELKEPAEPVDVTTGFDWTIPTQDTLSQSTETESQTSETTATYPDSYGGPALPSSNDLGTTHGFSGPDSPSGISAAPVSAPAGAGRSVKARLTHSIQPIN